MENIEIAEITPDLAREWLGFNSHNRHLRQRVVHAYAADMASGNWQWNGESIKFSKSGVLLDGQHRLASIVESGVTISMLVIRELPDETQQTVDGGAKRKFSDVLALRGERSSVALASIIRRVALWESGARKAESPIYAPTNAQMLQTLEKYPWLRSTALQSVTVSRNSGLPASVVGLCWWLFSQLSSDDADFFFSRLSDQQGLAKGDAVYELARSVRDAKDRRGSRSITHLTAITIKAWNAFRDGTTMGILVYRPGGSHPEKFPEPR